jgi:hypothetical protein
LRTSLSSVLAPRAKAAAHAAFLACALLVPAEGIDADTIFDTVDLTSDPWAYAIYAGAIDPNCDVAFAFEVPETSDFTLDFLELRLGLATNSGPNEIRVVIHEDAGLEPGGVLEDFLLTYALPPYSSDTPLLRIDSLAHPVLRAGNRYWVAAYGPESVPYLFAGAWFISSRWTVPHIPHAVSLNRGAWIVDEAEAAEFRVAATPVSACGDGTDNDGDGYVDWNRGPLGEPADPGCADSADLSEQSPLLACDDGADNDTDSSVDYPADIACENPSWTTENPECDDGADNADSDDPPLADWDGAGTGNPDPECVGPWAKSEAPSSRRCGLGAELALLLPPLMRLWLRRRRIPLLDGGLAGLAAAGRRLRS